MPKATPCKTRYMVSQTSPVAAASLWQQQVAQDSPSMGKKVNSAPFDNESDAHAE